MTVPLGAPPFVCAGLALCLLAAFSGPRTALAFLPLFLIGLVVVLPGLSTALAVAACILIALWLRPAPEALAPLVLAAAAGGLAAYVLLHTLQAAPAAQALPAILTGDLAATVFATAGACLVALAFSDGPGPIPPLAFGASGACIVLPPGPSAFAILASVIAIAFAHRRSCNLERRPS